MYYVGSDKKSVLQGTGYSGKGKSKNKPADQCKEDEGPLPENTYTMTSVPNEDYGPNAIRLKPKDESKMCGRGKKKKFWIHPDLQVSFGCIAMPDDKVLKKMAKSTDRELRVDSKCK